jgi:hypothetical protein
LSGETLGVNAAGGCPQGGVLSPLLWSHFWKVPRRRRISHTCTMWLWGYTSLKILSPGSVLHGTKWLLWHPP